MYNVDTAIKTLALKPARHIWCGAIMGARSGNTWVNDRTYYGDDYIVSAVVDIGAQSGGLQIGNAYCAKLTLTLLDGASVAQTDRIIMRVGFYDGTTKSGAISLGWFYVDTIKKSGKIITVTAYDKMLRGQKNYVSALTYPAALSDILAEITDKMNVSLSADFAIPYDGQITAAPAKGADADGNPIYYTRRETLAYIASLCGGNFYFDVGGHLALSRFAAVSDTFAAENSITADISADAFTVSGISWVVNGVSCTRADVDTNGVIEFTNVLAYAAKEPFLHAIETRLVGVTYHGGTITRQGCGWFEIGDIVSAQRADGTSANVLVTGINYTISDGAFTEKIYASAASDSECNYTTGDVSGQVVPQSVAQIETKTISDENVVIIDHIPTADDLRGKNTVFVRYNGTSTPQLISGNSTLYNSAGVYVEIYQYKPIIELNFENNLDNDGSGNYTIEMDYLGSGTGYAEGTSKNGMWLTPKKNQIQITDVGNLLINDFTTMFWFDIGNTNISSVYPDPMPFDMLRWEMNGIIYSIKKFNIKYSKQQHFQFVAGDNVIFDWSAEENCFYWGYMFVQKKGNKITWEFSNSTSGTDYTVQKYTLNLNVTSAGNYFILGDNVNCLTGSGYDNFRVFDCALTDEQIEKYLQSDWDNW